MLAGVQSVCDCMRNFRTACESRVQSATCFLHPETPLCTSATVSASKNTFGKPFRLRKRVFSLRDCSRCIKLSLRKPNCSVHLWLSSPTDKMSNLKPNMVAPMVPPITKPKVQQSEWRTFDRDGDGKLDEFEVRALEE